MQEIVVANWRVALGLFIVSKFEKKDKRVRYREFLTSIDAVQYVCKTILPNEIYIDEHLNVYYLLLKATYPNCTLVNTKLPTHRVLGIPPLTCSHPFQDTARHRLYAWWLWQLFMLKYYYGSWRKKIALLGVDEQLFLRRVTAKMGIQLNAYINPYNLLHDGLVDVPIIHLVPRELEYSWYKMGANEQFFYQPYQRKPDRDDSLFWEQIKPLLDKRERGEIQLVYASLGTLSEGNTKPATLFLNRLIAAFNDLPTTHLIVADKRLFANKPENSPANVHIVDWAPQTELLPYCDLMITHGGTNSILECVQAGVRLVAYPLNLTADHPGNTARMVSNGWGEQGNLRGATQSTIRQKISQMLSDSSSIEKRKQILMPPINDWQPKMDLAKSR
ncbi:glycosyltransferase [Spirosoma linguale]